MPGPSSLRLQCLAALLSAGRVPESSELAEQLCQVACFSGAWRDWNWLCEALTTRLACARWLLNDGVCLSGATSSSTAALRSLHCRRTALEPGALGLIVAQAPVLVSLELVQCRGLHADEFATLREGRRPRTALALRRLVIDSAREFTAEGLAPLVAHCPDLVELQLSHCEGDRAGTIWELIGEACRSLCTLSLAGMPVCGDAHALRSMSRALASLGALEALDLSQTGLEHRGLALVAEHVGQRLRMLRLDGPLIAPYEPRVELHGVLATLPGSQPFAALTELGLARCPQLCDASLALLAQRAGRLEIVDLSETDITCAGVTALAQACTGALRVLDLSWCEDVGPQAVRALASCCAASLEAVRLRCCALIDDGAVGLLLQSCANLRVFDVSRCTDVSDRAYEYLATRSLQVFDCSWTTISDVGVETVVSNNADLRTLSIQGAKDVTLAELMPQLGDKLPHLRMLDASWCNNISDAQLTALQAEYRSPRSLAVHFYYDMEIPECPERRSLPWHARWTDWHNLT